MPTIYTSCLTTAIKKSPIIRIPSLTQELLVEHDQKYAQRLTRNQEYRNNITKIKEQQQQLNNQLTPLRI